MPFISVARRLRWVFFLLMSALAAVVAVKNLFVVSPSLQFAVTFSREEALQAAETFRLENFPQLAARRQAIVFESDAALQHYVELEAGGVAGFQQLIGNPAAATHGWWVRLFSEGQEEELGVGFFPDGQLAGFAFRQPENNPGADLPEPEALALTEAAITSLLGEQFADYHLLNSAVVRQTRGRADHRFTWEHKHLQAGEARFRLEALLAGDQLVSLVRIKHIPQAFEQRFGEMRALNQRISQVANALMGLVFGLGGFLLGGIWLIRQGQLQWRKAVWPGVVLAAGLASVVIVNLPTAWMYYQTVTSSGTFLFQQLFQALATFFFFGIFWVALYAVAEGLSRMAFPRHPGLYGFFKAPQAASPEIAGRVLGAYIWTGFFLLYAVLFIALTARWGWWQPAWSQVDPNILASWRPGVAPLFNALQAGTWEECLFRAIPLSMAVLLGRRFGMLRPLVIGTLLLQALVFAGAHANYPNLPGYSRVVELFIPALVFGLVFLRYGLMIAILTHFLYDLVLMSLPLFMTDDSRLWIDRAIVIAAGLLPLLAVMWARWRAGSWQSLSDSARNQGLLVNVVVREQVAPPPVISVPGSWQFSPAVLVVITAIGIGGLLLAWTRPDAVQWQGYTASRSEALQAAEQVLQARGVQLESGWRASVTAIGGESNAYVWQEVGASGYQQLIGRYLSAPRWRVQWQRFDGPVEERTEVWTVLLNPDASLHAVSQRLPEARPGASLDREQALHLAAAFVAEAGWEDAAQWQEKAVREINRPARRDWVVEWLNPDDWQQDEATAWIRVVVAGDRVVDASRGIDTPEAWHRQQQIRQSERTPLNIAAAVLALVLFIAAISSFFGKQAAVRFSIRAALPWMAVIGSGYLLVGLLWLEPTLAHFDALGSWSAQLAVVLLSSLVSLAFVLAVVFLLVQVLYSLPVSPVGDARRAWPIGFALAIALAGVEAAVRSVIPVSYPPANYIGDYPTWIPWLTAILNPWKSLLGSLVLLVLATGLSRFTHTAKRWWLVMGVALVWLAATSLAQTDILAALAKSLATLITVGLLMALIRREQAAVALAMVMVNVLLNTLWVASADYPFAGFHAVLAMLVLALVSVCLFKHWLSWSARPIEN